MEVKDSKYDTLKVQICDDSALMRNLVSRIINDTPGMEVVGKAMNGKILLDEIPFMKPDIVLLDIEMPVMTGVEFLEERKKRKWDVPVVILSSIATKGAAVTVKCLELGAMDFITKPGGSVTTEVMDVKESIIEKIASYGGSYARRNGKLIPSTDFFLRSIKMREAEKFVAKQKGTEEVQVPLEPLLSGWKEPAKKEPVVVKPLRDGGKIEIIAIGISTGGPNALRDVFKMIDPHLKQPILVVQHMPAGFTAEFARSLNRICPLEVCEAQDEMPIEGGHVYIAPGNYHIIVEERISGNVIRTTQTEQRNGHRPSADVLFESIASVYKNNALGVIMTGMGRDGAAQLAEMRRQGAWTLGQDEASSIVYGMPRVGWELGGVQKQVPLMEMADEISRLAREHC
jgi:two-component system chemotaxis response regulator CheB